jgi:glutamate-ammonia-ligase adenylyltransferase
VRRAFEARHGVVPGTQAALLGFGKMASREMTMTSDLDFIMLYAPGTAEESDGEKPLATGLPGFIAYQHEQAWTWEHLALTRARVVAAGNDFGTVVDRGIAEVLSAPRNAAKVLSDVVSMRALMARERPPRHPFDLKLATGGLVDLEFVAQSGQLLAGAQIGLPQAATATVLDRMGETGLVSEGARLAEIHGVFSTVLQAMSAALVNPLREDDWTDAFRELVAALTHYPSFDRLRDDVGVMQGEVSAAAERWYARARLL